MECVHSSSLSEGAQAATLTADGLALVGPVRGVSGGTSRGDCQRRLLGLLCACWGAGLGAAEGPPPVGGAPHPCPLSADSSFLGLWENRAVRDSDRIWLQS